MTWRKERGRFKRIRRHLSATLGMTLAVCLLLITSSARANWQVVSAKSEASPNEALTHWRTELQDSVTAAKATLDCAIFRTDAATLQVIDQTDAPRKDLAEVMRETGALAGVNGGYFDPQEAPVGLLVSRGRTRSSLRRAKLLSGVLFATRSGKVDVVRSSRFRMSDHVEAAVQCGPLLVEDGEAVPGLNDSRQARRTFAAVDGRGHAILGVSSPVSLAQLARLLSQSNATGKLKPVRALNLDGGSSSAFWFAGEQGTKSIPELKTVRDFVAIVSHRRR